MSIELLFTFALTEFLMSLSPGPAVLLVVSQGLKSGFRASWRGTLGIEVCNAVFFTISATGLGAVLAASEKVYGVVRYVGVAYLIVTGVRMLISRHNAGQSEEVSRTDSSFKLFLQGFITQLVNPRAILFFIALLPQFVSTEKPIVGQFVVLGIISILVETPVLLGYGWLSASGGKLLPKKFAALPDRIAGIFLIGAGAALGLRRL